MRLMRGILFFSLLIITFDFFHYVLSILSVASKIVLVIYIIEILLFFIGLFVPNISYVLFGHKKNKVIARILPFAAKGPLRHTMFLNFPNK